MSDEKIRWVGDVAQRRRERNAAKANPKAKKKSTKPRPVIKACETCGTEIRVLPWQQRIGSGKFCSKKCQGIAKLTRVDEHGNDTRYRSERESYLRYVRPSREKNPSAASARAKVSYALRTGAITKGSCEVCGSKDVDAHHEDYSAPLDVRWLCRRHHLMLHRRPEAFAELVRRAA